MACTVEHRRLYCTTSDVSFGPLFESDQEGEWFRCWVYRHHGDPRQFSHEELTEMLEDFRGNFCRNGESCDKLLCPEHNGMDVWKDGMPC